METRQTARTTESVTNSRQTSLPSVFKAFQVYFAGTFIS